MKLAVADISQVEVSGGLCSSFVKFVSFFDVVGLGASQRSQSRPSQSEGRD